MRPGGVAGTQHTQNTGDWAEMLLKNKKVRSARLGLDQPGMKAPQKFVDMALPPAFAQEVIKSLNLKKKKKRLLVFELFAGVGGFRIGAKLAQPDAPTYSLEGRGRRRT